MNYYTDNPVLRHYLTHPLLRRIVEMRERNFTEAEKYDYAPVDFEEAVAGYEQILTLVGELCAEVVAPNAADVDRTGPMLDKGRVTYAAATDENMEMFRKAGYPAVVTADLISQHRYLLFSRTLLHVPMLGSVTYGACKSVPKQ